MASRTAWRGGDAVGHPPTEGEQEVVGELLVGALRNGDEACALTARERGPNLEEGRVQEQREREDDGGAREGSHLQPHGEACCGAQGRGGGEGQAAAAGRERALPDRTARG